MELESLFLINRFHHQFKFKVSQTSVFFLGYLVHFHTHGREGKSTNSWPKSHQKVVDRPAREGARRPAGSYDENPRKRKQRRTRDPGRVAVHLDKQGGHAGPLKYLIKLGPKVVQRAEEIGRTTGSKQSAVFDDMG